MGFTGWIQILQYFEDNKYLGYSIFVQSSLSQPIIDKIFKKYKRDEIESIEFEFMGQNQQGWEEIKIVEGMLIEAHRKKYGDIPKWNKIGGSIEGQKYKYNAENLLYILTLSADNHILARSCLREISDNSTIETFEEFLHNIRLRTFRLGFVDFEKEFNSVESPFYVRERIIKQKYLGKYPKLMCL